jgi:hypothetical protein
MSVTALECGDFSPLWWASKSGDKSPHSKRKDCKMASLRHSTSAIAVCVLFCAQAAADQWADFRARQRAEIATLPQPPQPSAGEGSAIDRFLASAWKAEGFTPPPPVEDRVFARRAYLDVIGLLPSPEQLDRFERDADPTKRTKLVGALLSDRVGYAEHWASFWNDLLRNDEQTNIDGLRKPITRWLYRSLLDNKPLDQFVAELLHPGKDGPDGYLKGVNWRGRVNASQTPPVQAAQNVAQVFLASSLKCASCHDSFINKWKLDQAYGMASFFAPAELEVHRCDKATGKKAAPRFLFAGLGEIPANADLETRLQTISHLVTRPQNPRFARALVNRLWKRLLGRGLIEPADDFDSTRTESPLLDWLAHDFMAHDYDAKHTLRQILLSRVYQLQVAKEVPQKGQATWTPRGPAERRMTSEQFLDSVAQVTGYWPRVHEMSVEVDDPHLRAWRHRKPDALATALGRPNREQVCTERNQESTVLQALELVNGQELASRLREGTKALLGSELGSKDAEEVLAVLWRRALGRVPSTEETAAAKPLLGLPKDGVAARQPGWEDVLWVLFLSPGFQFIR